MLALSKEKTVPAIPRSKAGTISSSCFARIAAMPVSKIVGIAAAGEFDPERICIQVLGELAERAPIAQSR